MEKNRVLSEQEKKRMRDVLLEQGFDPKYVSLSTDWQQTTLDVEIHEIFSRKMVDETVTKGIAPDVDIRSVIPQERLAELWTEAEAEAKKPFN